MCNPSHFHRVPIVVNSPLTYIFCLVSQRFLNALNYLLETTARRCTTEQTLSILRHPYFDLKLFEKQTRSLEQWENFAKDMADRMLNSIQLSLRPSII